MRNVPARLLLAVSAAVVPAALASVGTTAGWAVTAPATTAAATAPATTKTATKQAAPTTTAAPTTATTTATRQAAPTTTPVPTAAPTLVYTLAKRNTSTSRWTASADGSTVAIATAITNRRTNVATPIIEVLDLRTSTKRTFKLKASQYLPVDASLSADGRYLAWTTAKQRKGPSRSKIVDPTTWVRDLQTGTLRKYPHIDGNLYHGDGTFLVGIRGPMQRWKVQEDGQFSGEIDKGAGIYRLATRAFTAAPGRDTRTTQHQILSSTPDGSAFLVQFGGRCTVVTTATKTTKDLGACRDFAAGDLSADGTTAFIDSRGWIDTATGQLVGPALDQAPFAGDARAWTSGAAGTDLGAVIVQCTPGITSLDDDQQFTAPRRTYRLDRATRLFAPLAGPTTPLADPGSFITGIVQATAVGDELFWGDGQKVWRVATAPVGPAGPLPADCLPIR